MYILITGRYEGHGFKVLPVIQMAVSCLSFSSAFDPCPGSNACVWSIVHTTPLFLGRRGQVAFGRSGSDQRLVLWFIYWNMHLPDHHAVQYGAVGSYRRHQLKLAVPGLGHRKPDHLWAGRLYLGQVERIPL